MAALMFSWCRRAKFYNLGFKITKRHVFCIRNVKHDTTKRLCLAKKCCHHKNPGLYLLFVALDQNFGVHVRAFSSNSQDDGSPKINKKTNQPNYETVEYDIPTLQGEKKDVTCPLPKAFSPRFVEAAWYDWWVKEGFFTPEYMSKKSDNQSEKPFVMCLPPPNVTGTLHLGHALTNSIQDAIVRWNRMNGKETLWVPGSDHAGIATQVVVEKKLWQEQRKTRHDLGREKFVQEVWKWKHEKGNTIYKQMRKLGSSLDWNRVHFTMDEDLSRAVTEAFIRLHDEGLIFRSKRLVNWCCQLKSAISDIEVDNVTISKSTKLHVPGYDKPVKFGSLVSFAYPVHEKEEEIIVSTTRPETMLGDTAVAVHPQDERYTHLHGNHVKHPIEDRLLPIICDEFVDQNFGTGAVKITPNHDYVDFEVSNRHNVESLTVIDEEGNMTNVNERFNKMKRFDARLAVIETLKELGLYRGSKSHEMTIPICSRTRDIIEPYLKDQWYVNCADMGKETVKAIQNKKLIIQPEYYDKLWIERLENIRDWCISRQLWWGHRIPAYHATANGHTNNGIWVSARNESEAKDKASKLLSVSPEQISLKQDEDVLDTWFSSGLIPFSVFGWPDKTADLDRFYPTSLLETGSDIWFFWVARMVMLGQKLTGKLPFSQVYLHGLLRDAHGRKMSKSLGNVIDPLDVIHGSTLEALHEQLTTGNLDPAEIEKAKNGQKLDFPDGIPECGADALRFSLCSYDFKAQEINMDIKIIKANRQFCNKILQAYKFVTGFIGPDFTPVEQLQIETLDEIDQWILSRLSHMIESCDQHFQSYDLQVVTKVLKHFWISEFCDIYLECKKQVLKDVESESKETTRQVLYICVDSYLRAISPFMPYLSEELYQRLLPHSEVNRPVSICVAPYPHPSTVTYRNIEIENQMDVIPGICSKILQKVQSYKLKWFTVPIYINIKNEKLRNTITKKAFYGAVNTLSRSKSVDVLSEGDVVPSGCLKLFTDDDIEIHAMLKGLIDPHKEIENLKSKLNKLETSLQSLEEKSKKYRKDALEKHNKKISEIEKEIQKVKDNISDMENL